MEEPEKNISHKREKMKDWLKKPSNILIVCIFVFLIILRIHYTYLTANQPLWWDEAEYMASAKAYAGIIDFQISELRTPGFPLIASVFYMFGISNELILKFFLAFIPSIIAILLFYYLIREMYPDKRIAVISMLLFGVLWEHLFYSVRFHTENFSLIFQFLAMIVFIEVYVKKEKWYIITPKFSWIFIILFSIMAIIFRPTSAPFIPAMFLFGLLINISYLKKIKKAYLVALAIILIFLIVLLMTNLDKVPIVNAYYVESSPLAFHFLYSPFAGYYASVISWLPPIFLYLFYLGMFLALAKLVLLFDQLKNLENNKENIDFKSDILNLLLLLTVTFSFVFILRISQIEYRWFFMLLPAMFAFTSKAIIFISDIITKFFKMKYLAVIIMILIVLLGVYNQISHADMIIKTKLNSYEQVKDAGLWIKENTNKDDIIFTKSVPQNAYYSERKTYGIDANETEFYKDLKEKNPKYVIISVFEMYPEWALNPSQKLINMIDPVKVFYFDSEQKQLALIIYEYKE